MTDSGKSESAFRTIGELSTELGVPQHILRYWETRFTQLRPLTRAGNRRYYRPADVELVKRIDGALNRDGYTIKGVQKLLAGEKATPVAPMVEAAAVQRPEASLPASLAAELMQVRTLLAEALNA